MEAGERIIHRLGDTLMSEHEKLFDRYCLGVILGITDNKYSVPLVV